MKNFIFPLLFISAILFSCGDQSKSEDRAPNGGYESAAAPAPAKEDGAVLGASIPKPIEQKLIKNGNVSFRVKSLMETKRSIQSVVVAMNGYIAKENTYGYDNSPSEELTVRIPSKNFDKFLDDVLQGAEEVDSKNIDIEDVTEQFVDIEARLKNKKQLEAKYQELMVKATNMEDILKIEKEISLIREDIESAEGKLKYLSNRVSYSTITLRYYEKRSSGFNFGGKLGNAIKNGGTGFLWFLIGFSSLWPLWVFGALAWFIIVRSIRKKRKKKAENP